MTVRETGDLPSDSEREAPYRVTVRETGDLPSDSEGDRRLTE